MGLRFFADHCIPNSVIKGLLDGGHEVLRLRDYIPIESPDPIVIATAQELDSILISLNGDFTPLEMSVELLPIYIILKGLPLVRNIVLDAFQMPLASYF